MSSLEANCETSQISKRTCNLNKVESHVVSTGSPSEEGDGDRDQAKVNSHVGVVEGELEEAGKRNCSVLKVL
jgi:hypothetical protein